MGRRVYKKPLCTECLRFTRLPNDFVRKPDDTLVMRNKNKETHL